MINVIQLVSIARRFKESNVSIYDLLKQTGYLEHGNQISEKNIYEALISYPELVDDWINYSEDKRSSSGWYFKRADENKYLVGRLRKNSFRETKYEHELIACAAFIKYELDEISH